MNKNFREDNGKTNIENIMDTRQFEDTKKTMTKKQLVIILAILIVLLVSGIVGGYIFIKNRNNKIQIDSPIIDNPKEETPVVDETPKEVQIFKGTDRPVAVMIDNERPAWPHAGLNDAYLLYEITIEGGESRIMALFKGKTTEKIGPVRSSRHYFLDYVMENDAIYAHFGWSPLAQSDIKTYNINNINGIYDSYYWREAPLGSYHNAFTSMENITEYANRYKYRLTSTDKGVFTYSAEDINLENAITANTVKIEYSSFHNITYKYNAEKKVYERYMRDVAHKDRFTEEQFVAKNIIVCYMKNYLLDDPENKGRQQLEDVGTGTGSYITNGKCENIKWQKLSRETKTKYYDESGNQIVLNDGITWVQIVPIDNKIVVE